MTHASLFSGIGGFDLAAQWAGLNNIFQVEIDDFCNKVLEKHFPNVQRFKDIKNFDASKFRGTIDILSGGFPCQPFSQAGKREGRDDNRYLWPEMFRIISEVKPSWVVAENVYGLLNIEGGLVFEQIQSDLESEGYETQSFIIPAFAVNTWHKRNRLWVIANSNGERLQKARPEQQAPRAFMWKDSMHDRGKSNIGEIVGDKIGMKLQPAFVEWLMGFPEGWTDIGKKD
jgi:DNA (cytosine-5)-methyltransferase 1